MLKLIIFIAAGCVQAAPGESQGDNIVFEDFARMRRGISVDQP